MINIENKKVLVVGLGVSGYSAARLLLKKGALVKITDSSSDSEVKVRLDKLSKYNVDYELDGHTSHFCSDVDLVVTSPGVSSEALPILLAKEKGIPIIGELELASSFCQGKIIAITGTNGKSTTTELIGKVLSDAGIKTCVCGNIGNPMAGEVDSRDKDTTFVVEVSSFQLETIKDFKPYISVLLNVTDDHYDRHANLEEYKKEKFKIFSNQNKNDWAVINHTFSSDPIVDKIDSRIVFFGHAEGSARIKGGKVIYSFNDEENVLMETSQIPLIGHHNLENVACTLLVSKIMGISDGTIKDSIKSFKGLAHRFEKVADIDGVEFIDDSKATNIDATKRALESIEKKVVLIAGGIDKGGDYLSMLNLIENKVKAIILIGEAKEKIKEAYGGKVPTQSADSMKDAVRKAKSIALKGEAVMLSPMCSSFDMFSSYKERGDVFQKEVMS
jgi:UDP-N-acetylmuramoylalanine--D-glutamate ligase